MNKSHFSHSPSAYFYLVHEVFGLQHILQNEYSSRVIADELAQLPEQKKLGPEVWLWVSSLAVRNLAVFERMNEAILQEAHKRGLSLKLAWVDEGWWQTHLPESVQVGCMVFTDANLAHLYKQTVSNTSSEVAIEVLPNPIYYESDPRLKLVAWKKVQFILGRWFGSSVSSVV